jgi:hypothetical protein
LGRIDAGLDGGLQFLDVGKVLLAGSGRRAFGGLVRAGAASQQCIVQRHAAVAPEHQFLAVGQGHGHGSEGPSYQLLASEYPITFAQWPARSIRPDCEDFANDLPHDPD